MLGSTVLKAPSLSKYRQQPMIQDMTTRSRRNRRKTKRVRFQEPDHDEDDEDELCRCICGDNDFTAKRPWIQCTACEVWQHNECMNVSVFDNELGDHYWCEECDEERHTELLAAVRRGERPWEARVARRLEVKARFEERIEKVLTQVDWLWVIYEPQPSAVAGDDLIVPPKRSAPRPYVDAVQESLRLLFADLPMQSLRTLAQQLDLNDERHGVMKTLRRTTAKEYYESELQQLGVLAELFEWAKKGTLYVC